MDSSAEVLDEDIMGCRDDNLEQDGMEVEEPALVPSGKKEEDAVMKTRHVLELLASINNGDGSDQVLPLIHLAVYDQLKNWGIEADSPTTRGRSKARKSNSNKMSRSEAGQHRPVEVTLKQWNVSVRVPILIKETCDFLRQHITTEGIFRKSGSSSRVQALMQRFSNLEPLEEFTFNSCDTVFDVATVLKQYLREMDSPLIPYETHSIFRKCLEVPSECSRDEAVILSTSLLPESNIGILTYLIEFLVEVVEHSDTNRMTFENLAIVIGPNIMPVESKKSEKAKELELERKVIDAHKKIMEILIRNGDKIACLPRELEKKIESDISVRGSEDELENEGVSRRKKRRSGSLTRVLGFLKKVTSKTGDTPTAQTPVEFQDFTHTPVIKSGKRRCLDENIFSLQKKKTILDGIRKNGLILKDDDKRFAHITDTPNSVTGFITCPSPVCLNPSPMMKMDWKQTPNAARFKNLVTPSLLRRKDKNGGDSSKAHTPFSAPSKPVKAKILGGKKSSKKQTPVPSVLTDKNGESNSARRASDVKRVASTMSIHKLANSPRKVVRASSTRIPRPDKPIPVRKSNSSCRFPNNVAASPREAGRVASIPEKLSSNISSISGEYVRLSPSAQIRDEKNEAFIASKLSCLEDTVDLQENVGGGNPEPGLRLTPLIQEINTLTLTAQEELTLSGLRRKQRSCSRIGRGVNEKQSLSVEKPPPVPSRVTRRRSSGASTNKARLQSPPDATKASGNSQRKRHSGGGVNGGGRGGISGGGVTRSESIRKVEDKFKRAINETKIMRIQSERSAQVNARAVTIHRRFSVQDRGYSPSQRKIVSNAARRKSHELNRQQHTSTTTTAPPSSIINTPIDDLTRYGFQPSDSISRSPNRCTLKRGRPNTLRSGLARPSPASSSIRNTSANTSKQLNDSTKENPPPAPPAPGIVDLRHMSGGEPYMPTPMRRMSSVQELVQLMEKGKKEAMEKKKTISDSSLKPVNRTEPPPQKRTLSRRNSSASKFLKPAAPTMTQKIGDVTTPKNSRKRQNPNANCNTAPAKQVTVEAWVPASDFNFDTHRQRFLNRLSNRNNEDRDSIQALKTLNAGKVSENVKLFESRTRKSPGKSLIPRYVALHRQESFSKK